MEKTCEEPFPISLQVNLLTCTFHCPIEDALSTRPTELIDVIYVLAAVFGLFKSKSFLVNVKLAKNLKTSFANKSI